MSIKPRQFFILPDPMLPTRKITVHSATSEGGFKPGDAVPQIANQGAARPVLTRDPLQDIDFTIRVQGSGGIDDAGTWSYLSGAESGIEDYFGQDDQRYIRSPHGGAAPNTDPRHLAALHLPQTGQEFIYWRVTGSETINYRVRSVGQSPQGWGDVATITGVSGGEFDIIRLPDGTALMATAEGRDIDIYMSADGVIWVLKSRNILERFLEARSENPINGLQMEVSGDWVRMVWQTEDNLMAPYMQSIVSSDRGASWRGNLESTTITPGAVSGYTLDTFPFALIGVDDDAGSMLLLVRDDVNAYRVNVFTATGSSQWVENTDLVMDTELTNTSKRMRGQRAHSFIWILIMVRGGGTDEDEFEMWKVDPANPFDASGWLDMGTISGFLGTVKYHPGFHTLRFMGHYLALWGSLIDDDAASSTAGQPVYWQMGSWDKIPLGERWSVDNFDVLALPSAIHQPVGVFASIEWDSWMGTPAGPGGDTSTGTPWSVNRVNSTVLWNSWRIQISSTATIGDFWYAAFEDLVPTQSWCVSGFTSAQLAGSSIEWEMQGVFGSRSDRDAWAVRLRSKDFTGAGPATQAIDLSFRITPLTLHVIDNAAGASIAALPVPFGGAFDTDYHQFRIAFRPNPTAGNTEASRFNVKYRRVGQTSWSTSPTFIPNLFSGLTQQWIRFGHIDALIVGQSRVSRWRYCRILGTPNDLSQMNWVYPDDVRGRLMSGFPVWTLAGQHTHWMGGSAFETDLYNCFAGHHFPKENTLIASPSLEWRGESVVAGISRTDALIFTPTDPNARFSHDAISLFGLRTRRVTVAYDSDAAFPSPSNVGTLDTLLWGPLRLDGAVGNMLNLTPDQDGSPPLGSGASNPARKVYARITAVGGAGSTAAIGRTFLAEQHIIDRHILLSAAVDVSAFTLTGASIVLFGDRGTLIYSSPPDVTEKFMRLTFNAEEVHEGAHALGAMVPGISYQPATEIQWSHRDSEAPNVTNIRTRGAISWAYEEGPPQRVFTGRIVGDVVGDREIMRNLIRAIGYEVGPIVLHTDGDSASGLLDAERLVYGRLTSGMDFSNPAYKLQTLSGGAQRWQAVGDLVITIEETV